MALRAGTVFLYLIFLSAIAICGMHWHSLRRMERSCEMSYMWPAFEEVPVLNTLSIRYKLFRYRDATANEHGETFGWLGHLNYPVLYLTCPGPQYPYIQPRQYTREQKE